MRPPDKPNKTVLVLSFAFIVVMPALLSLYFAIHRAETDKPSDKLVSRLGPKYRGYKDYDPDTADRRQRAIVEAASDCLMKTGIVLEGFVSSTKKLVRFLPARKVWEVGYWSESPPEEDDAHHSLIVIEVDENLKGSYKGLITF